MSKNHKIPISKFISDKKLEKILKIITTSDDIQFNYDRIENILSEDFDVLDLGTNRLVLVHKKKKYKDYIFKIAGDSHGIEANYREFYNGDLDHRLTFSYSISDNGIAIVQERVKRMSSDDMKKYKKEVRKMLEKLSSKILLVDCKLSNFKNFGIRKNGELCLLDHGDTVPLPKYQGQEIVNIDEESSVSLRCKKTNEVSASEKSQHPCGGKLHYDKNFEYFICSKCGASSSINDAYREYYGDTRKTGKVKIKLDLLKDFDPNDWKEKIKEYCIQTMSNTNIKKENNKMGKKIKINGEMCTEIRGFYIPEPSSLYVGMFNSMKLGQITPQEYLTTIGIRDIDNYKVIKPINYEKNEENKEMQNDINLERASFEDIAKIAIKMAIENGEFENLISFDGLASRVEHELNCKRPYFTSTNIIRSIRNIIAEDDRVCGCVYKLDSKEFSVRIKQKSNNNIDSKTDNNNIIDSLKENKGNDMYKSINTLIDEDYINYAKRHNSKIVEDTITEEPEIGGKLILTQDDIDNNSIEFGMEKCVVIGKYAIPLSIILKYEEDGQFILPKKPKNLLKSNNLLPKKYKLENQPNDNNSENLSNNSISEEILEDNSVINSLDESENNEIEDYNTDEDSEINFDINNEHTRKDIIGTIYEFAKITAENNWRNKKIVTPKGEVILSMVDIMMQCLYTNSIIVKEFYSYSKIDNESIQINIDLDQYHNFMNYIMSDNDARTKISWSPVDMTIGILTDELEEKYSIKNNKERMYYYIQDYYKPEYVKSHPEISNMIISNDNIYHTLYDIVDFEKIDEKIDEADIEGCFHSYINICFDMVKKDSEVMLSYKNSIPSIADVLKMHDCIFEEYKRVNNDIFEEDNTRLMIVYKELNNSIYESSYNSFIENVIYNINAIINAIQKMYINIVKYYYKNDDSSYIDEMDSILKEEYNNAYGLLVDLKDMAINFNTIESAEDLESYLNNNSNNIEKEDDEDLKSELVDELISSINKLSEKIDNISKEINKSSEDNKSVSELKYEAEERNGIVSYNFNSSDLTNTVFTVIDDNHNKSVFDLGNLIRKVFKDTDSDKETYVTDVTTVNLE